jgi:glycosyltransferase involved in cell wall biosynthesis
VKISGFTIVRNAIKYDYPILEAIYSIAPLCDEIIVAVGKSDDETLKLIQSIKLPQLKIIETVWDDTLRQGGQVLAKETDKALAVVSSDSDWAIYIQGDEILHEEGLERLKKQLYAFKDNKQVDGLLFNYQHFYGSYDYLGLSSRWYRKEIRALKPNHGIYSYRDAQGFRKNNNQKLNVVLANASIYHYGWVKDPRAQQQKQESFHKMWHNDQWLENHVVKADNFDYSVIDALEKFEGEHPKVMQERINQANWKFDHDPSKNTLKWKDKVKFFVEKVTGFRPGEYKNYIEVKS